MGKTNTKAARRRGHQWERDVVSDIVKMGWEASTSRYSSRKLDDEGVDIDSDFPFRVQCKATTKPPNIHNLLTETAATAIFHRRISKQGDRFFKDGEYVSVSYDDFMDLIQRAYKNK